jgi:hypothetical protein
MAHAAQNLWNDSRQVVKAAGTVCLSPRAFEDQSSWKKGEASAWKLNKAHSILHKVHKLMLFGWPENFSMQGPKHCHIDFCKKVAACTNNKDVFLCILRHQLQAYLAGDDDIEPEEVAANRAEEWLAGND